MNTVTTGGTCFQVSINFQEIKGIPRPHFTGKEKAILQALKLRRGKVCTLQMFAAEMYPGKIGRNLPGQKIMDVMINRIRKKLCKFESPDSIDTVWGRGFRLGKPEPSVLSKYIPAELQSVDRWTPQRKEEVLLLIKKLKSPKAVFDFFTDLSQEELTEWRELYKESDRSSLRATRAWRNA
jgi:DNA-binding winged helix-turn-helix (wHTH) protein